MVEMSQKTSETDLHPCPKCCKTFTYRSNLLRHVRKGHRDDEILTGQVKFKCPLCETLASKSDLMIHFSRDHSVLIETERLQFSSLGKFESWKLAMERETAASFVKLRKDYTSKGLTRRSNYYCHRDGTFRSSSRNVRRVKFQGSNKINAHCPANITAFVSASGQVDVAFVKTHVGHDMESTRLSLMKNERDEIARKIANQVPFDSILELPNKRDGKLTRQDLYNIEMSYNLTKKGVRNRADLSYMDDWVTQINEGDESIVVFYKGRGSPHPLFTDNDFMIVLMNSVQNEMLAKYGSKRVCLDSTIGLGCLDVEMLTISVVDNAQQAFPCAFIFTNRVDVDALTHLFNEVEDAIQSLATTEILMADMNATVRDAWISAMSQPFIVLCNDWQVSQHWKNNLNSISNGQKRKEVSDILKALLEENDERNFNKTLQYALNFLKGDPEFGAFHEFFLKFANNPKEWTEWRRKQLGISTVHLRRLRKSLVDVYQQTRRFKRLDRTIEALLKLIKDKLFNDRLKMDKSRSACHLRVINKRHKLAMDNMITDVMKDGDCWLVPSNESGRTFRVERSHPNCGCDLRCADCDTCAHAFICTCNDSTVRWNMCTHIHIVCQVTNMLVHSNFTVEENEFDNEIPSAGSPQQMLLVDQLGEGSVIQAFNIDDFRHTIKSQLNNIMNAVEQTNNFEGLETIMNMLEPVVQSANSYQNEKN